MTIAIPADMFLVPQQISREDALRRLAQHWGDHPAWTLARFEQMTPRTLQLHYRKVFGTAQQGIAIEIVEELPEIAAPAELVSVA